MAHPQPHRWLAVVEPDPDLAEILRELLEEAGFGVALADGWGGLEALSGSGRAPDFALALVDLSPASVAGDALEARVGHPALRGVPLIGMSTLSTPVAPHPRLSAVLRKPFDPSELVDAIVRLAR